jgi:two-component system, response regulator PdtaR
MANRSQSTLMVRRLFERSRKIHDMASTATTVDTFDALNRLADRFGKLAMERGQGEPAALKVLIAEDDLLMADMIEEVLIAHGYEVCGIARTVAEAVALGALCKPDLAVLDLHLANAGLGTEIAARLSNLGRLGVLYATGNASTIALTATDGDACLSKPYHPDDLLRSLKLVVDIVVNGQAGPPYPRNFQPLRTSAMSALESPSA